MFTRIKSGEQSFKVMIIRSLPSNWVNDSARQLIILTF